MELLRILLATAVVLALLFGIRWLVEYLIANPSILRPSHHRRNAFMEKWRNQIIEHLLQNDSRDINAKITQAFPDADISTGTNADWTIIRAEYKGVPFTIHHKENGYFWLQLPPILSFSTTLSFDRQRKISMRIAEDFAPIRTNPKKELGATHLYLIGEYLSTAETWEEDECCLSGLLEEEYIEDCKNDLSKYIPEEVINIHQIPSEDNLFEIYFPREYKLELIKADNPYLMGPSCFNTNCPNQPFTSQEGLIISPNIDIVKAWIDLYLFVKDELK